MRRPCIILLTLALSLLCAACAPKKEKPKSKQPVPVKAVLAAQKTVPVQLKAIGNIESYTNVAIKSQVDGQIARVHFAEGTDVEKGALLVSIDPEPFQATLSQCEAALAKDQAQAKFARDQTNRYQGLLKDGIVTRDQYESLQSNAESLAAAVVADRAAIRNAKIQLGYCSIRSPISGRTGTITLHPGNLVKANDLPIVTINQISPIYVTLSVPEKRLAEVKRAMAAGQLKIEAAIPNEAGSEVGTVSFLDNAVNPATGTIKLKGVFPNKSRKLWPGQFTDVLITLAARQNAVVVPAHAIQTGQQGDFVYIVKPDNKVEMRPVVTAVTAGDEAVIEKGVAPGETVVVDGQLRLTPGATVEMMENQAAKGKKE